MRRLQTLAILGIVAAVAAVPSISTAGSGGATSAKAAKKCKKAKKVGLAAKKVCKKKKKAVTNPVGPTTPAPNPPAPPPSGPTERAKLTWNTAADLDLWVWDSLGNGGYKAGIGAGPLDDITPIPNALFPVDDTDGFGSETFTDTLAPSTREFAYQVCMAFDPTVTSSAYSITYVNGLGNTVTTTGEVAVGDAGDIYPAGADTPADCDDTPPPTLTVTPPTGTGSGTITGTGINCPGDCTETYAVGAAVTLTANPAVDSTFAGWSGDCAGTGTCALTMSANKAVSGSFTATPPPGP